MFCRAKWLGFGAAIAGVVVFTVPDASAFCRTYTARTKDKLSPPDYDASETGCWTPEGEVPIFWRNACVGYSMQASGSSKISYEDASNAVSLAFTRWTGATCPTDGTGRSRASIDVRDLGPAECAVVEYKSNVANQNVIIFRDRDWAYGESVLGLTTVNYNPENGEIFNADMELNTQDMNPLAVRVGKTEGDPVEHDEYDFLSVVTHEAGHFLGMAHSDVAGATMYARYDRGQTNMRYLSPDDINGICYVYRPDGTRAVLNHYETQAPQCDPTPRGGYSSKCQEKARACDVSPRSAPNGTLFSAIAVATLVALGVARRRLTKPL